MNRVALPIVACALVLTAGCGDKDEVKTVKIDSVARYCDLFRQLDEGATVNGAISASDLVNGDAAVLKSVVASYASVLDELQTVAPDEVSGEVRTVVVSLRQAADDDRSGVDSETFRAAVAKVDGHRGQNCGVTVGQGEG